MKLTKKQLKRVDHISTSMVEKDIADTQAEIDQYEKELEPLRGNLAGNKVAIYMREGQISKREAFIEKLNQILKYRGKATSEA